MARSVARARRNVANHPINNNTNASANSNINGNGRGNSYGNAVKLDPDGATDTNSINGSGTVNFGLDRNPNTYSNASNYGDSSSYLPVDQSFYRNGRSDAPTPSERLADPEPLLREVRMRPHNIAESPTSQDPTESFFHTSFQDIGKKLKACNDTLGELQQLGVSHDVQLPELVLVGDQSAGKSSLMSGLANLELPRSEGTCTRCPLHIRVSRNDNWSCRVWLRKEYVYQPPSDRPITESDVTDSYPFFPWAKLPLTQVHEFKTMHDRAEIEEVLRWAQIAILNDNKSHKLFVPGSGSIAQNVPISQAAEQVTAKFSPNVVALEIKGPDLPDLSFYDMPGIFQNPADARDDYLVSVVRNLSREYIQHPSAIILCSMPMNSDAENSSTFGLTRRLGALNRTIGVLTKADLLPKEGNHDQWLSIMKGEAHRTGLGYFITSRPQGKDLEDLNKWEEAMFQHFSFEAWPRSFHCFSDRCGVEKLKAFLSERLGEEFAKSLPTIKRKVKVHLDKIIGQLAKLPELPNNVELVVQTSLMEFGERARSELTPEKFSKQFGKLPDDFRDCLLDMKPKFTLKDKSDIPILEISDDESDSASTTFTPSKRPNRRLPMTPSKRQKNSTPNPPSFSNHVKAEEGRGSVPPLAFPSLGPPPPPSPIKRAVFPEPFTKFSDVGRGFRTLRQVREEINSKTRTGMPGFHSDEVYNDMCREAVLPWDGPMKAFLGQVMHLLRNRLEDALRNSFAPLNKRLIYQESRQLLRDYLEERRRGTEEALAMVYRLETYSLFTINRDTFEVCKRNEARTLKRFRHQMRMHGAGLADSKPPVPWESLTEEKLAQEDKRREGELAKIGPDPFEEELKVVAYIRGYYRLAALRFADSVALHITNGMIPDIQRQLPYYLDRKLGLRGPDASSVYERLMEEDEATATRRESLKIELERFERALASIEGLEAGPETNGLSEHDGPDTDVVMSGAIHVDDEA